MSIPISYKRFKQNRYYRLKETVHKDEKRPINSKHINNMNSKLIF